MIHHIYTEYIILVCWERELVEVGGFALCVCVLFCFVLFFGVFVGGKGFTQLLAHF